jgi:hypothetical protein
MSIPLLLILGGILVVVALHVSIRVEDARNERRRLRQLQQEGRTIEWEEILPRLEHGTISIQARGSMGSPSKDDVLLLWWLDRQLSHDEMLTLDGKAEQWKAIVGAPRWARKWRTLKRRCPETVVFHWELTSQLLREISSV